MITTNDPAKCIKFNIVPFNTDLKCQEFKANCESTTIKRNGCWNCIYYR